MKYLLLGILLLPCVLGLRLFNKYNSLTSIKKLNKMYNSKKLEVSQNLLNHYEFGIKQDILLLKFIVGLGYIECYLLSHFLKIVRPDLDISIF